MKDFRKLLLPVAIAFIFLGPSTSHAALIDESETVETVGIFVRGLKICHQREWRNLSITLEYETENNESDIQAIKEFARIFLEEYSSPDDYWEVMNTKLVHTLAKTFTDLKAMKSTLSVAPDQTLHFPRESIVKFDTVSKTLKESFKYTKLNYHINHEPFRSLNLHISWDMKNTSNTSADYPDYRWVDEALDTFFKDHPVSYSNWKTLKPQLQAYLSTRFPTVTSINVEITVIE